MILEKMIKDEESIGLGLKTTIVSFLGFIALTAILPWSSFTLFNYFMKEALNWFLLTSSVILGFSVVLGAVTAYVNFRFKSVGKNFFAVLGVLWIVNFYLTLAETSFSIFSYTQMNGFFYTLINMLVLAAILPLLSFMLTHTYRMLKNKEMTFSSSGGLVSWLFSVGCPSCGAALYSLLGVSAGLTILPFKGLELKLLSLGLVAYSFEKMDISKKKSKKPKFTLTKKKKNKKLDKFDNALVLVIIAVGAVMLFNEVAILKIGTSLGAQSVLFVRNSKLATLADVDMSQLTSTAATVSAVFPELKQAKTEQEVIDIMLPSGTPDYSDSLGGISFDDPVNSLNYLSKWYYVVKEEVKKNPEKWKRYLNLAAAPRGISCEFCCGVGPQGVTSSGDLTCGCQHNPAAQAIALGLIQYTDYSDAEVMREVMKWKTTFFPQKMVAAGIEVAGKDPSQVSAASLPGMVGGC